MSADVLPGSVLIDAAKSCNWQRARPPDWWINQRLGIPVRGYELEGRRFESFRARQIKEPGFMPGFFIGGAWPDENLTFDNLAQRDWTPARSAGAPQG